MQCDSFIKKAIRSAKCKKKRWLAKGFLINLGNTLHFLLRMGSLVNGIKREPKR